MLSLIMPKFKDQVGLYRDDGLAVCKAAPREIEKTKQEVSNVFKSHGLKITIEANKKTVNFLDVTLDLTSGSYKPYMKPNNKLLYVHQQSNNPPALKNNIPLNINKRVSNISSGKEIFNEAIPPYQKALEKSGYDFKLTFNPEQTTRKKKNRKKNTAWYSPPWDSNVKTNLGKKFLGIIDKCFPPNHPLHKIFNSHTLKLSYSSMPNMKTIISTHNKKMLSQDTATPGPTQQQERTCNCRKKPECSLEGNCLQANVVYQTSVTTEATNESYVGLATNFKDGYRNHMTSFPYANRRNETELSKHISTLKDARKPFRV